MREQVAHEGSGVAHEGAPRTSCATSNGATARCLLAPTAGPAPTRPLDADGGAPSGHVMDDRAFQCAQRVPPIHPSTPDEELCRRGRDEPILWAIENVADDHIEDRGGCQILPDEGSPAQHLCRYGELRRRWRGPD